MLPHNSRIKPRALHPGDKVGIVAPASNVKRELLEAGCRRPSPRRLRTLLLSSRSSIVISTSQDQPSAGRENSKTMFVRDDIRAIVCARGGYGSNYLLPDARFEGAGLGKNRGRIPKFSWVTAT
jgi:muramoyltetrapeptide carboxypeptidase